MVLTGKIANYRSGSKTVGVDGQTALWLGRMLVGEGYHGDSGPAVLWAVLNRYFAAGKHWTDFLSFIRAFSQPINDRWLPGGDLYETARRKPGEQWQTATSMAAVQRRKAIRRMQWADLPIAVQELVGRFALGTLPYPAVFGNQRWDNFGSYPGIADKYPGGTWIGENYFFQSLPAPGKITVYRGVGTVPGWKKESEPIHVFPGLIGAAAFILAIWYLTKN